MIEMFPSAKLDIGYMLDFIPQIKPRLYSIASAQETTGNSLHLCVVGDDWTTPSGKYQHGLCSGYLSVPCQRIMARRSRLALCLPR